MVALLSQARLKSSLTPRFNQVPDDFYRVFEARAYPTETSLQHAEIKKEDLLYWAQKSPALDQRGMLPTSHFKLIWVLADNDHGQKGIAQSQFWDLCKAFCIDTSLSLYESHRFDSLYYSERHHGQTPACLSFYFRILDAIVYSSFIPATETKRAILFAPRNVAWEDFFFASLRTLSISNPLSLYAWLRATQSENIQTRLQSAFSIVYQVEIDTGYSTSLDPLDVPPGYNPPMNPDLSELSKAVGSAANGIDRACLMIRFSKSLRMVLSTDNGLRWQELFNDSRRDKYMAECHKMFKIDDIVQSILDQYLIKASVYEQRSRNLLNVVRGFFFLFQGFISSSCLHLNPFFRKPGYKIILRTHHAVSVFLTYSNDIPLNPHCRDKDLRTTIMFRF